MSFFKKVSRWFADYDEPETTAQQSLPEMCEEYLDVRATIRQLETHAEELKQRVTEQVRFEQGRKTAHIEGGFVVRKKDVSSVRLEKGQDRTDFLAANPQFSNLDINRDAILHHIAVSGESPKGVVYNKREHISIEKV